MEKGRYTMKGFFRVLILLILSIFLVNIMCMTGFAEFVDVDPHTTEGKAIEDMQSHGYIQGFGDGTFRPGATLTRAEFVTIVNRMYAYYVQANNIFRDIKPADWYYGDVLAAVQVGYIRGFGDGTFRPDETVTREQVCVMLNSILKIESELYDVKIVDVISDWAEKDVKKAISNGLFDLEKGDTFRATQPITRGEVCVALQKCIVDKTEVEVSFGDRKELEEILKKAIAKMKENVIPACTYPETKQVAEMITESLEKYLQNPEHDYIADTKAVFEVYSKFDSKKVNEIKGLIFGTMDADELMILYSFFYDGDINSVLGE